MAAVSLSGSCTRNGSFLTLLELEQETAGRSTSQFAYFVFVVPGTSPGVALALALFLKFKASYNAACGTEFISLTIRGYLLSLLGAASLKSIVVVTLWACRERRLNGWNGAGRVTDVEREFCRVLPGAGQQLFAVLDTSIGAFESVGQHFVGHPLVDENQIVRVFLDAKGAALLCNGKLALHRRRNGHGT